MSAFDQNSGLQVLRRALDGLAFRQQVISNNVANVDTPGFKASEVRFEDVLQQAIGHNGIGGLPLATTQAQHIGGAEVMSQPQVVTLKGAARGDGNTVDVDREMSRLAETQIAYSAAARLVNSKLGLLRSIVTDGRR